MSKPIPIGTRGEAEQRVEFEHTLTKINPDLPPVYSTPHMIGLMETAGYHALKPFCEGDEISVGTAINVEHKSSVGVGALVKAEAVLQSFDGRFYVLRVSAKNGEQELGCGTVTRAIVSLAKILKRLGQKA